MGAWPAVTIANNAECTLFQEMMGREMESKEGLIETKKTKTKETKERLA